MNTALNLNAILKLQRLIKEIGIPFTPHVLTLPPLPPTPLPSSYCYLSFSILPYLSPSSSLSPSLPPSSPILLLLFLLFLLSSIKHLFCILPYLFPFFYILPPLSPTPLLLILLFLSPFLPPFHPFTPPPPPLPLLHTMEVKSTSET